MLRPHTVIFTALALALSGCSSTSEPQDTNDPEPSQMMSASNSGSMGCSDDADCQADEQCVERACVCATPTCPEGASCGEIVNQCGNSTTCGTCAEGSECDLTALVCVCDPPRCPEDAECSQVTNACGESISCGTGCAEGSTCDEASKTCACEPLVCMTGSCGTLEDVCGGAIECGACAGTELCFSNLCSTPSLDAPRDRRDHSNFGAEVAIGGEFIFVGAPSNPGSSTRGLQGRVYAYHYERGGALGTRTEITSTLQRDGVASGFGDALAATDETLVVSAPQLTVEDAAGDLLEELGGVAVFSLQRETMTWIEAQELARPPELTTPGTSFGASVSLAGDRIAVGAPGHDGAAESGDTVRKSGAVALFRFDGSSWELEQLIAPPDPAVNSGFGLAVELAGDHLYVGAPNHSSKRGAVYIYELLEDGAEHRHTLPGPANERGEFGATIEGLEGELFVAAPERSDNAGAVYHYQLDATNQQEPWAQLRRYVVRDTSYFGACVDASEDHLLIGAPLTTRDDARQLEGAAFIATRRSSGAFSDFDTYTPGAATLGARFGEGCALAPGVAAIGATRRGDFFGNGGDGRGTVTLLAPKRN